MLTWRNSTEIHAAFALLELLVEYFVKEQDNIPEDDDMHSIHHLIFEYW